MSLNPPQKNWQGQVVWLIGASSGIGRATAAALHSRGAKVIVSARNTLALNEFASSHAGAVAVPLDVTDTDAVRIAAEHVISEFAPTTILYSAGHYHEMAAQSFGLTDLKRHLQVNYVGLLNVLDSIVPYFLARAGRMPRESGLHISLVGSVAGYSGLPKSLAYGPTKAAMANLAETLYLDLRDAGVGVSLICPGFVDTPLTAQNTFNMPALISPDQAAQEILTGWSRGEFEIHFPKRFTLWLKLLRILPYRLAFLATRRLTGG